MIFLWRFSTGLERSRCWCFALLVWVILRLPGKRSETLFENWYIQFGKFCDRFGHRGLQPGWLLNLMVLMWGKPTFRSKSYIKFLFYRDDSSFQDNIFAGVICMAFFFLVICLLTAPNGPFVRPHPAFWRLVFGLSVLYLMLMLLLIFQVPCKNENF